MKREFLEENDHRSQARDPGVTIAKSRGRSTAQSVPNPSGGLEPPPGWYCLRATDVARRLGLHPKTVRRNFRRYGGKRMGGRLRFCLDGVLGALK